MGKPNRSGGASSLVVVICLVVAALVLRADAPRAQGAAPPAELQPKVVELQRGQPFLDDVRRLPSTLPPQRERRRDHVEERDEPPLQVTSAGGDRAVQNSAPAAPAPAPGSGNGAGSFAGLDYAGFGDGWPPDTNGDVGPSYYIQTVNTSVGVFRKSDGGMAAGFSFDTLMSQGHFGNSCDNQNFGDPVVVWDPGADRWIISDFAFALSGGNPVAPYFQCFAVSRTGDPVSGGWYFYSLQINDLFPDYPKLGVWPDGLYLTANMFTTNTFKNVRAWALNKAQMYAGAPVTAVAFDLPSKIQGVSIFTGIPSTYHSVTGTPPAGRPEFISVIWSAKLARIWKFHVDWNTPANSTLTGPSAVTLASWGVAGTSVPAKNGNALDTLRERLMVQSQYTNFGGNESIWLTHTVANPNNSGLTSPRWYQINVSGGNVVTSAPVQQSTWAPDASVARWMPSLAIDKDGNVALGYSASSSTLFPAIRYAGRLATDAGSTFGQSETSLVEGSASQCCNFSDGSANNRWGDYSAMTIDPDGCTFWYTSEYYIAPQPVSLSSDNWQTRIGSFKYASCTPVGALQGTVTSAANSSPIGGATVTAGSNVTTTNGSGVYSFASLAPATYTVTAAAAGYATGSASVVVSSGATTTQNFSLAATGAAATSLAVGSASGTYGGTTTVSATLTSGGSGVSGKSVSFSLNGTGVGSASTNSSGLATLSNVSLSGINAGTYASGVAASFAGDGSYASSSGTNSLTIAKANQTITFGPLADKTTSDPPFTVTATASSGLTVTFTASGPCTVSGNTVTITGAGTCTITAHQAGNSNYNAAPDVPQSFNITSSTSTGPSAAFVGIDTTTQGSWSGVYGGDGYNVINDSVNYPTYAQVAPTGQSNYTWAASTADVRGLQKATNLADRIAATWYGSSFSIDVNLTDGNTHKVALYVVDWDSTTRAETLEVHDAATNALLDTRTASAFHNGQYFVWNIQGHVTVRVILTGGANAVVSGLFFGGNAPPPPTATASFVSVDSSTQGSWKGVHGSDGYNVINDSVSYPAYAQVAPSGQLNYTWASSTTDVRALQKGASTTDRIAATWYGSAFSIDVNFTDGLTHRLALYVLDWDSTSRTETIEVRDAVSNALLDSRSVTGFNGGQYWMWNITGHVTIRVINTGGANAVVSGLFFGS
jgi:carboxypeptidase family protein